MNNYVFGPIRVLMVILGIEKSYKKLKSHVKNLKVVHGSTGTYKGPARVSALGIVYFWTTIKYQFQF